MPIRSNDFQRLITFIELQLAPSGAKVTASAMLYDPKADTEREVDILVEYDLGIRSFRTGIECRDRARPADVTWAEQAYQAHRDLGLDRTVLVSRSGFSGPARKKAQQLGIEVLTLEEATATDWAARLGLVEFQLDVLQAPRIVELSIGLHPSSSLQNPMPMPVATTELEDALGRSLGSAREVALEWVGSEAVEAFLRAQSLGQNELTIDLALIPRVAMFVVDPNGVRHQIEAIQMVVVQAKESVTIKMIPVRYAGREIAYGFGELDGIPFQLHAVRLPETDEFQLALAYPPEFKEQVDVRSFRLSLTALLEEHRQ